MDHLPEISETNEKNMEKEENKIKNKDRVYGEITEKAADEGENRKGKRGRFATGFVMGAATALICISVFLCGWIAGDSFHVKKEQTEAQAGAEILTDSETLYKIKEVQEIIAQNYYEEADAKDLEASLFRGIAAGLDDPYADYYSVQELQSVLDSNRGEYFGIGATLSEDRNTGKITVMEVYEDSPAAQAGLQTDDQILAVGDLQIPGTDLTDLVSWIKAQEGAFSVRIYREMAEDELELTMECAEIEITYVQYEIKEKQTGYIRISEFTESAADQFEMAVKELKAEGMEKLIVDLRNNPGGLLSSVCDILDDVLPEGLIVYTEDKYGNRKEYSSEGNPLVDCEIAVLVNGYSASASEIFAGAVQDYGLGPIIGQKTYGKGVVQNTYTLSDGSAFKLTVQKYFTPKGQDINGNGIMPDILIEEPADTDPAEEEGENISDILTEEEVQTEMQDYVLEKALEALREEG